jgi:hypothetical protein
MPVSLEQRLRFDAAAGAARQQRHNVADRATVRATQAVRAHLPWSVLLDLAQQPRITATGRGPCCGPPEAPWGAKRSSGLCARGQVAEPAKVK